jgi:hypothetical protein
VAAAVRASLSAQLGSRPLTCSSLWLAEPPPGVHLGVWGVVCLASIAAMDSGRRLMVSQRIEPDSQLPPAGPGLATVAGRHAVAQLWDLQDFCTLGAAPASWRAAVLAQHPFLRWQPDRQSWRLRRRHPEME